MMRRALVLGVILACAAVAVGQELEEMLEQVEELYMQARDDEALPLCEQIVAAYPDSPEAYCARGRARRGEAELAIEDFDRAIELKPDCIAAYIGRGWWLYDPVDKAAAQREWRKALDLCAQAIEANPQDPDVYFQRGRALYSLREYAAAAEDFEECVALDPLNARAHSELGETCNRLQNYDEAIEHYDRAIELYPQYAAAYFSRGFNRWEGQDHDGAIQDYTTALEINPDYASAYLQRGFVYSQTGRLDEALAEYDKAIEADPESGWGYSYRGMLYVYQRDNPDRAIEEYNKAIEVQPDSGNFYQNRAIAYTYKEDWEHALEDFDKAIELAPWDFNTYFFRARNCYYPRGDYAAAWADIHKCREVVAEQGYAWEPPERFLDKLREKMPEPQDANDANGQ